MLALSVLVALGAAVARVSAHERTVKRPEGRASARDFHNSGPLTVTVPARYAGKTAHQWHRVAYLQQRRIRSLKRTLMSSPTVSEAINLAATVYGNGATLWRKARCESNLDPNARNGSEASGLFQFLPSTWRTTPFGGYSIFSAYANALAAGWMHAHNRGSEWSCR